MNKYLIKCINDCSTSYAVAYASSLDDDMMDIAADNHAFDVAVSIVPDSLIVQLEGYDYDDLTEEDIRRIVDSINWEEYYNYSIAPFEGTDEEFNTYPLIYDGRNVDELYPEVLRIEDSITECGE